MNPIVVSEQNQEPCSRLHAIILLLFLILFFVSTYSGLDIDKGIVVFGDLLDMHTLLRALVHSR